MNATETIARAAIMHEGVPYDVPRPGRHHNVIAMLGSIFWQHETGFHGEQGFITNTGRFVDRKEGLRIAQAAGQVVHKHGNATALFSEDMW